MQGNTYNIYLLGSGQPALTNCTISNSCTGNVDLPVNVTNFENVGSISLTLIFDTTKLSYVDYSSVNGTLSGGLIAVNRSGNKVRMTWASTR